MPSWPRESLTNGYPRLRKKLPELIKIATGKEQRPPQLDTFAAAFAIARQEQEKMADQESLVLLKRFALYPDVPKAMEKFEHAKKVEQAFHKDFDGLDFADR